MYNKNTAMEKFDVFFKVNEMRFYMFYAKLN